MQFLGHILISDLVVANLFMYRYDSTLLGRTFFTQKVFLHKIAYTDHEIYGVLKSWFSHVYIVLWRAPLSSTIQYMAKPLF